ncbi:MAG: 2-succinyl-6-hydroxy-2,4-cyclohexadiene-1-carboxylate synthase [Chloroflexi bacterium]|nr:2-succinyl-6-hydroxy-2,4-cyclohexadiene-1-carboxylate synthase [Chloroflexota bacterium]
MKINGVEYAVNISGHGDPLVLLHGFTGSAANWGAHVAAFSGDFTVVTVDLLGHGRSDSPTDPERYAIERATADLHAIFRACSIEAPHLLGYSMGGRLALYYALRHGVRSLLLESASPGLADDAERDVRRQSDEKLAEKIEQEGLAAFVDAWEKLPLFASQSALAEDARAALRQQRLANNPVGLANSLRGMGTGVQPSLWSRLGTLDSPALLLCGALDAKFTGIAREMAKRLRNARLAIAPSAGHTIHLERPTFFRDEVLRFLLDIARRRMP